MFPLDVHCAEGQRVELSFQSELVVHAEIIEIQKLKKNWVLAAEEQLKFLNGQWSTQDRQGQRVVLLGGQTVSILDVAPTSYPLNLVIDDVEGQDAQYGLRPQQWKRGDRAMRIRYKMHRQAILCGKKKPLIAALPIDPYGAFWTVPKKSRRELTFHEVKKITNPCAHNHMAELAAPHLFWYAWHPFRTAPLDCEQELKESVLSINVAVQPVVVRPETVSYSFLKQADPLRVSLIQGLMKSEKELPGGLKRAHALLSDPLLLHWLSPPQRLPVEKLEGQDVSVLSTLDILLGLQAAIELKSIEYRALGDALRLDVTGYRKGTKNRFEMQIFVGTTVNYMPGVKPWDFLREALTSSDFIFYNGHADAGHAFKLSHLQRSKEIALPEYQFIGIISCFSTAYFGEDFLALRNRPGLTTDMLLVGFEGYPFSLVLAVIDFTDKASRGLAKNSFSQALQTYLNPTQNVHIERVRR